MKINDILDQEFYADKEKSASAIALYKAREEARLTQANSAERTGVSTIYYCTN